MEHNEYISLLSVGHFIRKYWWMWLLVTAIGVGGAIPYFIAIEPDPPVLSESRAVLLLSNKNSSDFYVAVMDAWPVGPFSMVESVDVSTSPSLLMVSMTTHAGFDAADGLAELIRFIQAKGGELRAIQTEERKAEADALADFLGDDVAMMDLPTLAPSLGTLTVMIPPSPPTRLAAPPNEIKRNVAMVGFLMLIVSSGASLAYDVISRAKYSNDNPPEVIE